jgi:hypothetical protein
VSSAKSFSISTILLRITLKLEAAVVQIGSLYSYFYPAKRGTRIDSKFFSFRYPPNRRHLPKKTPIFLYIWLVPSIPPMYLFFLSQDYFFSSYDENQRWNRILFLGWVANDSQTMSFLHVSLLLCKGINLSPQFNNVPRGSGIDTVEHRPQPARNAVLPKKPIQQSYRFLGLPFRLHM